MKISEETQLYTYSATATRVVDGDTIKVDINLGFHIILKDQIVRLARIDAPETKGLTKPAGEAAKNYLHERVIGKAIVIKTKRHGKGKYGRYIAEVFRIDTKDPININDLMVSKGHAIYRQF